MLGLFYRYKVHCVRALSYGDRMESQVFELELISRISESLLGSFTDPLGGDQGSKNAGQSFFINQVRKRVMC